MLRARSTAWISNSASMRRARSPLELRESDEVRESEAMEAACGKPGSIPSKTAGAKQYTGTDRAPIEGGRRFSPREKPRVRTDTMSRHTEHHRTPPNTLAHGTVTA